MANVFDKMTSAADPPRSVAIFVGAVSLFFAVGATITGFMFTQAEKND